MRKLAAVAFILVGLAATGYAQNNQPAPKPAEQTQAAVTFEPVPIPPEKLEGFSPETQEKLKQIWQQEQFAKRFTTLFEKLVAMDDPRIDKALKEAGVTVVDKAGVTQFPRPAAKPATK